MSGKTHLSAVRAVLAVAALSVGVVLFMAPAASAEDSCPPDWICGETAPPLPPDQAGNPEPVTIDWTPIPDVPPSFSVPLDLPAPPKQKACKKKPKHAAVSKKCRSRKRK